METAGQLFVAGGVESLGLLVVGECQSDVLLVIRTLRLATRLTGPLHGWKQQPDQRADDRKHRQQLDDRKP
jgi:hypothetical protein